MSERYPILGILIPFIAGIIFRLVIPSFPAVILTIVLFAFFLFFFSVIATKKTACKIIIFILSFYCGFYALALQSEKSKSMDLQGIMPPSSDAVAIGDVVSIPEVRNGKTVFLLNCEKIRIGEKYYTPSGKIRVSVRDSLDDIHYGSEVQVSGKISPVRSFQNFNTFDYAAYLRDKGICLNLSVQGGFFLKRSYSQKTSFLSFVFSVREYLISAIRRNLSSPYSDLCAGILVGARDFIPENIQDDFIRSGTYHLFAISGFHIGIISASVFFLLRLFGLGRKKSALFSSFSVIFYSFIAGMGDSVVRAMIMALCFFASIIAEREGNANNSLFSALLIVLVINPAGLFGAGTLLTFIATFFIINCSPLLYEKLSFVPFKYLRGLLAGTMSAQIGIIPVLAYFFNYISPAGIIANILCVPSASLAFIWGIISSLTSFASAHIGGMLFAVEEIFLFILFELVKFFSSLPLSYINLVSPGIIEIFLYYLLVSAVFFKSFEKAKTYIIPISFFFLVSSGIAGNAGFFKPHVLTATFLDVGEGESAVFESPQGRAFMVDTGGTFDNSFDIGGKIIVPALLKNGIRRLDAIFITHPHSDHINGIISIIKNISVGEIYVGECFSKNDFVLLKEINKEARERGTIVSKVYSGFRKKFDEVEITVLYPEKSDCISGFGNINNISLLMSVSYSGRKVLLTADAEKEAINKIMERGIDIKCDVVKIAHHGGRTSAVKSFYKLTGAKYAVISAGYNNRFNHPSPEMLEIIDTLGMKEFRTGLDGAVRIELSVKGLAFYTARDK